MVDQVGLMGGPLAWDAPEGDDSRARFHGGRVYVWVDGRWLTSSEYRKLYVRPKCRPEPAPKLCEECDKELDGRKRYYCSHRCASRAYKRRRGYVFKEDRPIQPCPVCGAPASWLPDVCCSERCQKIRRQQQLGGVNCEQCGEWVWHEHSKRRRRFCSIQCSQEHQREGAPSLAGVTRNVLEPLATSTTVEALEELVELASRGVPQKATAATLNTSGHTFKGGDWTATRVKQKLRYIRAAIVDNGRL